MVAEPDGRVMEPDDRQIAADGQQHESGTASSKIGIELERTGHNLGA